MDINICITGAAVDGGKEAGELCARLFSELGYFVFVYQEYQSRIRGGHNASVVRVSDRRVHAHRRYYDLLVCLEDYVYRMHREFVRGGIIHDTKFSCGDADALGVPMTEIVRESGMPALFRNAASLGALTAYFSVEFEVLEKVFREAFGKRADADISISRKAYDYYLENYEPEIVVESAGERKEIVSGGVAIAEGMLSAGLDCYYAYPMTPASPILHYLVKRDGVITYQPESEIAAVCMAIGSAFAGKRSATGTSGGGFGLMCESVGLAAMAEVPLLVVEAQRSGPSTGMATFHGQEDLEFVLNPSHGEFPLVVASPYCVEDAYPLSAELMNLAWKYQIPAILLTDKHLVESSETADIEPASASPESVEVIDSSEEVFRRYEITESGVSRYAVPPAIVKFNSNEHDEYGITTDDAEVRTKMHEKRMKKERRIANEIKDRAFAEFFSGRDVIVTWGSTFGAAYEVAEELGYRLVVLRYLRPLILPDIDHATVIECNYTGQLAKLLKGRGVSVESVLKWDGRPFTPEELREVLG
ncbi:2-oxoacid:acceptor oxidoreductase subunit alpha [Geoglobus sp.]